MKTHSLDVAVVKMLGEDSGMKDPRGWVIRQIKKGRFEALRVGRHLRMTDEQIDAAIKAITTSPAEPEPTLAPECRPHGLSLTATSARRLKSVAP